MRHILPMILIMDPDLPPPTRIRQSSVLSLDLDALFKAGREAEFNKVFEGLEQAKPEDWGELIDLRFQELALRQYAPTATPAVKPSEPTTLAKPAAASSITRLSKRAKLQAKQVALKLKQAEKPGQTPPDVPGELDDMEPISFQEAARRLGKSVELVRGRFMKMPGVQRIPSPRKRGVRPYHTWAIPVPLFEAVKESWKVK